MIFALSLFATLIFTSITNNNDSATLFNYFGIVTLLEGAIYVIKVIFEKIDAHRLRKVLRETHASEIMFGLFMAMLISGIMLIFTEESITNIHDALWYTFAIVTTIGFGDFYAVSFIGRIISVILGIYGIIVTALITSIIVNLYNEKQNSNNKK